MQQEVIIVGGGMVGLSLALMLAKQNIAVKLLEAIKYPNYDDVNLAPYHSSLMHETAHCLVVQFKFTKNWVYGALYKNMQRLF